MIRIQAFHKPNSKAGTRDMILFILYVFIHILKIVSRG